MDPKDRAPQILQFGVFEIDLSQGELRKFGHKIKLQDRPFQLLAALLERPGQVVTRDELVRRLWTDTLVDFDNGLNIAAKKVREALDDDASTPRYVETLPRRGYRFIAPVQARILPVAEAPPPPVVKPEPPPAITPPPAAPARQPWRSRAIYGRIAALVVVVFLLVRLYWLATSVRPARLVQAVQLTQTGRAEFGNGVATDDSRVYFTEREGGRWSLAQVAVEGGNPLPLPVQLPNPDILDISPDRATLLVSSDNGIGGDRPLWLVPTVGGSPRRVGDVTGHAGTWSRDGRSIVFARGAALYSVNSDGTELRKILDTPGLPESIRWAPAPEREVLRFSLFDPGAKPSGLWEAAPNGSGLHHLLERWNQTTVATDGDDGGTWAAGGKYFLFRSLRGRVASVWAMRENRTFPRAVEGPPVQLYSTPMQFTSMAPSPDGKRVFFAAGQERRELVRYDEGHRQFLPFLPGVSGRSAGYSKDEHWIAYVTVPDDTLWRSRPDGSERLQLTPPSFAAHQPHWSPDGKHIIFDGARVGQGGLSTKLYAIAADGGASETLSGSGVSDADAVWSPDGSTLLFGRTPAPGASGQSGLFLMDWKSRKTSFVPGSEALARPAWSADGRYIAATNRGGTQIMLLDRRARRWTPLASGEGLGAPFWSHDSKFVYYQEVLGGSEQPIFRVPMDGRGKELMMNAQQIPQSNVGYLLVGLAPDDAPIATVIHTNSDIYALDVELP